MTVARNKNSLSSKQLKDRLFAELKKALGREILAEYKFHPVRKWRIDFFDPASRLGIEVEGGIFTGGRHTNPAGFIKDVEKYNRCTLFGIRLYRIPHNDLRSVRKLLEHITLIKQCAEVR